MADGGEGEGGGFGVAFGDDNMSLFLLEFGLMGGEGFVEFDDFAFGGVFFLEEGVDLEFFVVREALLFFDVGGVDEYFGIVHGAPANHAAVVGKGGELIFLDIFVNGFLDVEVFAHK